MKPWAQLCLQLLRAVLSGVFSFALWTCWLALAVLLAAQLYILSSHELALPGFALRQIEAQLAESGLRATFGRASFDPNGQILLEDVRVSLPAFAEPVLTARAVFVRVNPALLLAGKIEARELRLNGVTLLAPAMFSPTGRAEEMLRDFDTTLEPRLRTVAIRQLSGRFANLTITAHGTFVLVPSTEKRAASAVIADFIAHLFPPLCRQVLDFSAQLAQCDDPAVHLEFSPSASGALSLEVRASVRQVRLSGRADAEADDVRLATRVVLFGDATPADLEVTAARVLLPADTLVTGLRARILGRLQLASPAFDLREINLTAESIATPTLETRAVSAQIFPRPLPAIETNAVGTILGSPLAVNLEAHLGTRRATVRFRGDLPPNLLDLVSTRVGTNVRRFFDYQSLFVERAEARFGEGFAFERLDARVVLPHVNAYNVTLTDARATLELTPTFFYAPEAFARIGENFARGTYEQDFLTKRYRFLLAGKLKPLEISGWFREWWPNFFRQLEFPGGPPEAEVDVAGVWSDGGKSHVFVFADVDQPVVRGAALDRVRTRLFIRPGFIDGLELLATRADRDAAGTFTYRADRFTQEWHTLDLDLTSNFDLKTAAQIIGPVGADILTPIQLVRPPEVKLSGRFAGPAAPDTHTRLHLDARTMGDFRYYGFPLQDVAFSAQIERNEIALENITGSFAGGAVTGQVRVWGAGAGRRLGFDLALEDAGLGPAAAAFTEFSAARKNEEPPPAGKFIQQKANVRLSLAASAEGAYTDTLSYRGTGSAMLRGAEIGAVPLLGSLSELFKFTSLRFTEARGNFKIEGPRLTFPAVTIRGANSAIDAHGSYALDRQQLDFNAKLFPFQESESLLKTVVGVVLSPLSNAFEVRLTGSLAKPEWRLALGSAGAPGAIPAPTDAAGKAEKPVGESIAAPPHISGAGAPPAPPPSPAIPGK